MKYLSARRRHPLAGLLVVLLGLLAVGALYSALRPAAADDSTKTDEELITAGRHLYVVSCSTCHGLNAEGVVSKRGNNYGPPLVGVGAAAVDFQVGTGRMPAQQSGTQVPDKERVFNSEETRALAAYIASLGPGPAIPAEGAYNAEGATEEMVVRGGQLYLTNCSACHNYAASGGALRDGRYAPPLLDVESKYMYEAMLTGPQQMPVFSDQVLTPEDKLSIISYINVLKSQPAYGGSGLGSLGPTTEGLWAWLGGVGALVLAAVWIANNGARAENKA